MTGFEVYQTYISLKLHFTREDYNYFLFNGKTRASVNAFEKRKDNYYFKKIASSYSDSEIIGYLVSHLIEDPNMWIGHIYSPKSEIYQSWRKRTESMQYVFCKDLDHLISCDSNIDNWFKCSESHPLIIREYMGQRICLETVVILEIIFEFINSIDSKITDPILWPDIKKKLRKYKSFLRVDKTKYIRTLKDKLLSAHDSSHEESKQTTEETNKYEFSRS